MGCGASKVPAPNGDTNQTPVWSQYDKREKLGTGMSCAVYATRGKNGERVAVKELRKYDPRHKRIDNDQKHMYEVEVAILKNVEHPNCIEFVSAQEESRYYYIVTKLCEGGELFDRVRDISVFTERSASSLAKQMLEALSYLHSKNIVHRDLKPENFVFGTKEYKTMKLIDFGCAVQRMKEEDEVKDNAGSPYYVAPEVLNGMANTLKSWKAADVWSIGVIVYLLLYGVPPFFGRHYNETYTLIRKGRYALPQGPSKDARNFIRKCLQMSPQSRMSAAEALKHPFIVNAGDARLPDTVRKSLSTFHGQTKLKKAVARMIAKHMTARDRRIVEKAFREADKNGDGKLDAEEIAALLKKVGKSDEEIKKIVDDMDADNDGGVDKEEFEQMHATGILGTNKNDVKDVFKLFDKNSDGKVDADEIAAFCDFLTPDKIREAVNEADGDGNGKISFDEWVKAMDVIDVPKKEVKTNKEEKKEQK
mmetsp:Transcript_28981/g.46542  ORF Transcript_28981/g.46542 Transcript_28981/m.46542 type:complete len:478 (-) Transcript_28981:316-1749(-)|eukprot:jgi/Bigna1/87494/estExt_fgenesh1_pg.C_210022